MECASNADVPSSVFGVSHFADDKTSFDRYNADGIVKITYYTSIPRQQFLTGIQHRTSESPDAWPCQKPHWSLSEQFLPPAPAFFGGTEDLLVNNKTNKMIFK